MARSGGSRASAPSVASKYAVPRQRGDTLRRPRLVDAIQGMIDRQLNLVVAPAGYGKTTLLVDFAASGSMPVCWCTLEPADADPAIFLESLLAAIRSRFPRFGRRTRRVMNESNVRGSAAAIIASLAREIRDRLPDAFALILDDYQEVNHKPAVNALIDGLLAQEPANMRLIVASTLMPRMHLSRLAALRQAAGVGARELRFTTDEVHAWMRDVRHSPMPARVIEQLIDRSDGWITGIVLTLNTMWQGLFESMVRKAPQEELFAELAGEMLSRQRPRLMRLLLASSILDDVEPAIAGALAGVSRPGGILREMDEGNPFVTRLTCRRPTYRYHQLLRDFLRSRLDAGEQGLSRAALERQAGLLYQQRGELRQAIPHLLAGAAFDEAAAALADVGDAAFASGHLETLAGWLDLLPDEYRQAQPTLRDWQDRIAAELAHDAQIAAAEAKAAAARPPSRRRRPALRLLPAASSG